jgi:gentisate 1,2-dioxygenase
MTDTAIAPERQAFYDRLNPESLAPLWERLHALVTRTPTSPARPYHWNYDGVVRPFMMESGGLISAKEAERRVLILENPGRRCALSSKVMALTPPSRVSARSWSRAIS